MTGMDSPKLKGTGVISTVKFLRSNREAALAALPPRLHRYLDERVLVSAWYPEEDITALWRAMATLIPTGRTEALRQMGRVSAREDLTGIYKHFLKEGDPLSTLRKMSVIWKFYHDTGRVEVEQGGECGARVILADFGLPSQEMCEINRGWFTMLVELAGAREIETLHESCCCRGNDLCVWEMKWKVTDET